MTLDIIIPHYKESEQVIEPLLTSINFQQGIDFNKINIILVNDGKDVILSDSFLNKFKNLNISYYIRDHAGVSATRNFGITTSKADYIMFCDSDDMFIRLDALWTILLIIKQMSPDIFIPNFIVEFQKNIANVADDTLMLNNSWLSAITYSSIKNTDNIDKLFIDSDKPPFNKFYQTIFLHGKVFKRNFLIDNNIYFPKDLHIAEDKYFLDLCYVCSNATLQFSSPFYLWKYNTNSVTRKAMANAPEMAPDLLFTKELIESAKLELTAFIERNKEQTAALRAFSLIYDFYLLLVGYPYEITENTIYYMQQLNELLYLNFDFFNNLLNKAPKELKYNIIAEVKENHKIQPGLQEDNLKKYSFDEWWKKIENLKK